MKPKLKLKTNGIIYKWAGKYMGWIYHCAVCDHKIVWRYALNNRPAVFDPLHGGIFGLRSHQLDGGDGA